MAKARSSAEKAARKAAARAMRNRARKSMVKTFIAKAERFISEGNRLAAEEAVRQAISALDRAAQRRVIHPNNAARRKSRLMRKFNQVFRETAAIASEPGAAR